MNVMLRRGDRELLLFLQSSSSEPVAYRVETTGPHLNADEPRGTFVGSTQLKIAVKDVGVHAGTVEGSIRIISSIGDLVVDATMETGLSGYYQGSMIYEAPLPLGTASFALELSEASGDVSARVDAAASLLFPLIADQPATGQGRFTKGDGLTTITVLQRVEGDFGGDRNHFARAVHRRIRFLLLPGSAPGLLEGTFEEEVQGLFPTAVRATGRVALFVARDRPAPPPFTVSFPAVAAAPNAGVYASPREIFMWTGPESDCSALAGLGCALLEPERQANCRSNLRSAVTEIIGASAGSLAAALDDRQSYATLAASCSDALAARSAADYVGDAAMCGMPAPLACTLEVLSQSDGDRDSIGASYVEALAKMTGPAVLVAQHEITEALEKSFAVGLGAERAHYDRALAALRPIGRWILQPAVLEYLRLLPASAAQGPADAILPWPAARSMADIVTLLSHLDGEQARVAVATNAGNQPAAAHEAQEHALLVYLESLALSELTHGWTGVPSTIVGRFSATLGPLDRGFSALVQGSNHFGMPSGYVPFVYDPENAAAQGTTNFGQVLSQATRIVSVEAGFEAAFMDSARRFDSDASALQRELAEIAVRFDGELRAICGPSFQLPSEVDGEPDWTQCGKMGTGELALVEARAQVAEREARALVARAAARADQIKVSERTLKTVLRLRSDEIAFTLSTGETINVLSDVQGVLGAISHGITVASNSQLWNLGVPGVLAGLVIALDTISSGIESSKNHLRLAVEAKSAYTGLEVERLRGIESLQREWIELKQLALEADGASRALVLNAIERRNLLDRAKLLLDERRRSLVLAASDPSRDPAVRLVRDRAALDVLRSRSDAQRKLWLAARALSYEVNAPLPNVEAAVLGANNAQRLTALAECFQSILDEHRQLFSTPQRYVDEISVRRLLGVNGPRVDNVTGQRLTEGEQFRLLLQQQRNGTGELTVRFATTLQAGNGLWSTNVCDDRIESIEAKLVGDLLGDDDARITVALLGTGLQRECGTDAISAWEFGVNDRSSAAGLAIVQAGVNTFGNAPPNTSLYSQPVARATWSVSLPAGDVEPANLDVQPGNLDDIILRVTHRAAPRHPGAGAVSLDCLSH